jgi:hypothetical protein
MPKHELKGENRSHGDARGRLMTPNLPRRLWLTPEPSGAKLQIHGDYGHSVLAFSIFSKAVALDVASAFEHGLNGGAQCPSAFSVDY